MASHAAFPAMLRLGEGQDQVMTAAGRLTSVYRSLESCTREDARSDSGAAAVLSKNTRRACAAVHCRTWASSSDDDG